MSGTNEQADKAISTESPNKDITDFSLNNTFVMDSNKVTDVETLIHEELEQIVNSVMEMESNTKTGQIVECRSDEFTPSVCDDLQLNQIAELEKTPNSSFDEDQLSMIYQMVKEKRFSKFDNPQPYSPSHLLAAAFQNLKINVTADETFLSCHDQSEACLVTENNLVDDETMFNDNNESYVECANQIFSDADNMISEKLECNSYENFEIARDVSFTSEVEFRENLIPKQNNEALNDDNIQNHLHVMQPCLSETSKQDIIAEIKPELGTEQTDEQTEEMINENFMVQNISNMESETHNSFIPTLDNKLHILNSSRDKQENTSKIIEPSLISLDLPEVIPDVMQDNNENLVPKQDNEPLDDDDNNIQNQLHVLQPRLSEIFKQNVTTEIKPELDIEQSDCGNITIQNIEVTHQTSVEYTTNENLTVQNISNIESETHNSLITTEDNKLHDVKNVGDNQVNTSKIIEPNLTFTDLSKADTDVIQEINKLDYNNTEECFEEKNERKDLPCDSTPILEFENGNNKPVLGTVVTPCENFDNEEGFEINISIPRSRKSTGVTITSIKMDLTPPPLRSLHNNLHSELFNASPSIFTEKSSDYEKYISYKLDINRLQQTIAKLKMEIKEKEAKVIKLFPQKIKYDHENLKLNDEKENVSNLDQNEEDINKKQLVSVEEIKLNNKIISLEKELKLATERQAELLEKKKSDQIEIESLTNENKKLKQCLYDGDLIISKFSSDLSEYKKSIENEKAKFNELSIKYERVKQILYCMKSNEVIFKKQLERK